MKLRSERDLARWLGAAGLDHERIPVVYDGYDGQAGSMLVWILEYLGCREVRLMDIFLDHWMKEGREVFYRPVPPLAKEFRAEINPSVRATLDLLQRSSDSKLIDLRSREEYTGAVDTEGRPGHIPGAKNIVWRDLLTQERRFLAPRERLESLLASSDIRPGDRVVVYCRSGMRAAVGYVALSHMGLGVRLYDGSYAEWVQRGLPVEV
jgi:thiosulfate/3-mercaptopyruvate sulfurtransferase